MIKFNQPMQLFLMSLLLFFLVDVTRSDLLVNGCGSANNSNCISVGFSYPSIGSLGTEGLLMKNGYILWAQMANINGITVNGTTYNINLIGYENYSNLTVMVATYQQLLSEVDFLLGPYGTSHVDAANAVANGAGQLMVFGSGVGDELFTQGYTTIFGVSTVATLYAQTGLAALSQAGAQTVAIAYATISFTVEVYNGTLTYLSQYNLTSAGPAQTFTTGNVTSITLALQTIKTYNADVVMVLGQYADAQAFVNISQAIGLCPKAFFLTSAPGVDTFVQQFGNLVSYMIGPVQWSPGLNPVDHVDALFGNSNNYTAQYLNMFGAVPDQYSAEASAAGLVLQIGIQNANSLQQSAIISVLQSLSINTFYGNITFDSTGKNIAKPVYTVQIVNGTSLLVAPPHDQQMNLIYPIPYPLATTQAVTTQSVTTQAVTTQSVTTQAVTTQSVTTNHVVTTSSIIPSGNETFQLCANITIPILKDPIQACWEADFIDCQITTKILIDGDVIATTTEPVGQTPTFFKNGSCDSIPITLGLCQFCTYWSGELILNSTEFSGCREAQVVCGSDVVLTLDLGCFSNYDVIPRCFGSCPENCNYNGVCSDGFCQCQPEFSGPTCSQPSSICPNNCGGPIRGSCVNGACVCTSQFYGIDCSQYLVGQTSSQQNRAWVIPVIVVCVVLGVILIIVIIVFAVRKYRNRQIQYHEESMSEYSNTE